MARFCALIPGVTGTVGRALARYLATQPDWEVIGVARRPPAIPPLYPVICIDIADAEACRSRQAEFTKVTHLLYCARASHIASIKEPIEDNLDMLRNVLDSVEAAAPGLRHVHILQGSKVYGSDLGPYKTPAKESDPRVADNNWYYAQEDLVAARSRGKPWRWSASRPHGVSDNEPGVARNMALMIGVYAAISRELNQPFCFPGTPGNFRALYQSVDAELLAKAVAWITTTPACADEAFNVTNGDYIRWVNLWPELAAFFGMETGPVNTVSLVKVMADKAPVWDLIVRQHGLRPTPYEHAAVWSYADFNWLRDHDKMSDTIKLRQTGFHDCMDTGRMFLDNLGRLRQERWIP